MAMDRYAALSFLVLATALPLLAQPVNNACADALPLAVNATGACPGAAVAASTANATNTGGVPACDAGTVQDIWYTFSTAGFANPFRLDIAGIGAAHWAAELYVGDCAGAVFACYPGAPAQMVFNNLAVDATYVLRLFSTTDIGAAGDLTLCLHADPIISWCGAMVYDAGGPTGNYPGNLLPYNVTYVYCPDDPGTAINLTFTAFNTRPEDVLRIYNGPDINSPLLGTFAGNLTNNLPGSYNSTHPSGCLTLRFSYGGFFFTAPGWAATSTCCSTPVVTVEPFSSSPVCIGGELQLVALSDGAAGFQWSGPGGFSSTSQNPLLTGFAQANAGTYSVVGISAVPGCNSNTATVTVGSIVPPPSVSASASAVELCSPGTVDLTASVPTGLVGLQQGFEVFPATGFGTSGTGLTAASNTTYFIEGVRSVRLSHATDANGSYGMTSSIDLTALPSPRLSFWHICALEQGWDYGFVEYSVNNGGTWAQLPAASYLGTGNSNFNPNTRFSRNSYAVWQAQFTGSGSTPGTGPATDLWRFEEFDLSAFATSNAFRIRFRITSDGTINYFGWLIDDVRITGEIPALNVLWSSAPAGFSASGLQVTDVQVDATTTFTVTASSAPGCSTSASVTVALVGPQITIQGAPGLSVCQGEAFDLVGGATGGTPPYVYTWYNGDVLLGTTPTVQNVTLNASGTIVLTVFDGGSCDNQAFLQVEVLPLPTVTLGAFATVCANHAPFSLSGGAPAGGVYTVNGNVATTFDPAAGPGSYDVVYTYQDANGCEGQASATLLVDPCAGIDEWTAAGVRMYPNPAVDQFFLVADIGVFHLRVLDMAGRELLAFGAQPAGDQVRGFALNGLANGAYTVELVTDAGRRMSTRLVVAR